ncbi:MAG: hypothetical protein IH591_16140 [Bacteroidales bacterium]|nr:hypothetical protein [Bacteroidales bacterium]
MKNRIFYTLLILLVPFLMMGQSEADITSKCVLSAGPNTTYLKDHVIKLARATSKTSIPVVKENLYLMKNFKYRFTLCNAEGSQGELTISIYDSDRKITGSYDEKSGKVYNSIDFVCNKTGMYTLWYSFRNGEQGMGVGVVSLIK